MQQECVKANLEMKYFAIPTEKAHIALLAFDIQEDNIEQIREMVMRVLVEKVDRHLLKDKFEVEVKGLDSFDNTGLYAEVEKGEDILRMLNEVFMDAFEEAGFVCDSRFTPHVSIMQDGLVPDQVFKRFRDKYFGKQEVSSVKLLSMTKPPTSYGFYHCYGDFNFKFELAE